MSENIYTAISAVMRQVGYVQKDGKVGSGSYGYSYAGEAAFIDALRPAMIEAGIVVFPAGIRVLNQDEFTTSKGAVMNRDTIVACYHFHHGASDTGFDVEVTGQGSDSGDKSANKAMTSAFKYALRQTFMIETGDDPDKELSQPRATSTGNQRQPVSKPQGNQGDDPSNYVDTKSQRFIAWMIRGEKQYGDDWDGKRGDLCEAVTKGRTRSSAELYPAEFAKLDKGVTGVAA